jgi:hypothetical protein
MGGSEASVPFVQKSAIGHYPELLLSNFSPHVYLPGSSYCYPNTARSVFELGTL